MLQVTSFIENWESNCPHYPENRKEDIRKTLKDKKAQTKHRKQTKYRLNQTRMVKAKIKTVKQSMPST